MNLSKISEIILGGLLTLFIGLYFRLSTQLDEMTKVNSVLIEKVENISNDVNRNSLEIEKLKVSINEQKLDLLDKIYTLRMDCAKWFKELSEKIKD